MRLSVRSCIPWRLSAFRAPACVVAFAMLLALPSRRAAQTTYAAITGTVTDSTGAVLKGCGRHRHERRNGCDDEGDDEQRRRLHRAAVARRSVLCSASSPRASASSSSPTSRSSRATCATSTRSWRSAASKRPYRSRAGMHQLSSTPRGSATPAPPSSCAPCRSTIRACGRTSRSPRCSRSGAAPTPSPAASTTSRSSRSTGRR